MRLERLKEMQMNEILAYENSLDKILTPDSIVPNHLKEFPLAMETGERLKRICRFKATELKDAMQLIEDASMDSIEQQEYVFKLNGGGQPVMKKKFTSANARQRELRRRLNESIEYEKLNVDYLQWNMLYSDWVSHVNRLRREMRLLEAEYAASGSDVWQRNYDNSFNKNKNT